MSATEATETEEDPEGEEPPEIDPEEQADVSLDDLDVDPADVEAEAGAGAGEEQGDDDDDGDDGSDSPETTTTGESGQQTPLSKGAETWGDQYVEMLALLLGEIAEASDGETGKSAEDIEELAKNPPVNLNDNVDRWIEESGMGREIPPGKAVAIGTLGLVAIVLITETDIAGDLLDDFGNDLL